MIVGGGRRGVVATACYVARTYGVKSAMPMFKALALCPAAIVIRPDMEKYVRVGREVRALMLDLTPLVEPVSIDEAFLDLSGTERLHGRSPAKSLAAFARRVEDNIGITVSIGLSANKFLAKIASDLDKPRGFAVLSQADARAFLAPKPVTAIFGVGKASEARLARDGYRTIADLQRADETELMRRYGTEGQRLWRLARGIDARLVRPERETKSVSAETTFETDIGTFRTLEQRLWRLSERVSARLKARDLSGRDRDAEAQDRGFQDPHPRARPRCADRARRQDLRGRPRAAEARGRRNEVPADRHRHVGSRGGRGRRPGRPRGPRRAAARPRPSTRSTACARSSAATP